MAPAWSPLRACALHLALVSVGLSAPHKSVQSEVIRKVAEPFRVVIFKAARTGSTWMADILAHEPSVASFEHEVSGCVKPLGRDAHRRAMFSILAAPSCEMPCNTRSGNRTRDGGDPLDEPAWLAPAPRPAPACLAGRLVGFDVQATSTFGDRREAPLDWARDWPPLLRLPGVRTVVYARSNAVKRVVSKLHVDALVEHCHGHKVVTAKSRACYERHRAQIDVPLAFSGAELARRAHGEGADWAQLVGRAEAAAGAPIFVMYYEALQRSADREVRRLFHFVGLGGAPVSATSESVKITNDDLRTVFANFSRVEDELKNADPCLVPQLRDTEFKTFAKICLANGATARFEDLDYDGDDGP